MPRLCHSSTCGRWKSPLRAEALTWPPNLLQNYLPSQEGMAHSQFIKMMIIFSIAFITVLILKVRGPASPSSGKGGEPLLPSLLLAPYSSPPTPAPWTPLRIPGDIPLRGRGSVKTPPPHRVQVSRT